MDSNLDAPVAAATTPSAGSVEGTSTSDGSTTDGSITDGPATDGSVPGDRELPDPADIMRLLEGVIDPELGSNIVELGMAKHALVAADGLVTVRVALTTAGCPLRGQIQKDVKTRVGSLPGVTAVKIDWAELTQEEKAAAMARARRNKADAAPDTAVPATTRVIAVASGKGGVGKSSVTANLAAALAQQGFTVGVLDADIWGFSIPRMLGVEGRLQGADDASGADSAASVTPSTPTDPTTRNGAGTPAAAHASNDPATPAAAETDGPTTNGRGRIAPHRKAVGPGMLEIVSMGFLVEDEGSALMWRGLMLNRAVQHFLEDVAWGPLDYLLMDMPPGTGDVQMGVARMLPRTEMIVVTTPAVSAQKVAIRAVDMARKSYLRVAGVIENMSAFTCEHGTSYALFGEGGGATLARDAGIPLLGQVPIEPAVAAGSDSGRPAVLDGDGPAASVFRAIAERIVAEAVPPMEMAGCSARLDPVPTEPSETAVELSGTTRR